ncbi:hypothetical protein D3C73_1440850 [compost metagenome]
MTCTTQDSQGAGDKRCHDGNVFWVTTQQLFSNLQHNIKTAGGLQSCGSSDHGNNDQHNVYWRFTRLEMEHENQNDQTDTA